MSVGIFQRVHCMRNGDLGGEDCLDAWIEYLVLWLIGVTHAPQFLLFLPRRLFAPRPFSAFAVERYVAQPAFALPLHAAIVSSIIRAISCRYFDARSCIPATRKAGNAAHCAPYLFASSTVVAP